MLQKPALENIKYETAQEFGLLHRQNQENVHAAYKKLRFKQGKYTIEKINK